MIRRATLVALPVVLVAAVAAAALHGEEGPGPAQGRVDVAEGTVVVTPAEGPARTVTDDEIVDFGETVEVRAGTATLELADGSTYELRHHDGVGSRLLVGAPPELLAGDALVVGGFPAVVQVGTATLRAQGALKVEAGEESAAAYAGRTGVAGVGDVTELPGLRRLVLVDGAQPEPIDFDGSDPWDRRHLGEAIAFGEQLEALARGYTRDLPPGGGRTEAFFRSVVPALAEEREFGADLLDPARPPGETLVGAAIAVQGREGTFRGRWQEIFAFRGAGAAWGLVALDQGVSSAPVLETIELAIATPAGAPGADADGSASDGPDGGAADPSPTTTGSTTTTTTAPPEPSPEPSDDLLDPPPEPVGELLDGLLDALLGTP